MGRKLFISDIHGCYEALIKVLTYADYRADKDKLIVGGDMIDRGPDSARVLKHIKTLKDNFPNQVTVLKGNHEHMQEMCAEGDNMMWLAHGGAEALDSYEDVFTSEEENEYIQWCNNLPTIAMDNEYVYVHAGIVPTFPLDQQDANELMWMPYSTSGIRFSNYKDHEAVLKCTSDRKVIHGHTPKPYVFDTGVSICCDGGAGVREDGSLNLVDLTNDTVYYVDMRDLKTYKRKIARKK